MHYLLCFSHMRHLCINVNYAISNFLEILAQWTSTIIITLSPYTLSPGLFRHLLFPYLGSHCPRKQWRKSEDHRRFLWLGSYGFPLTCNELTMFCWVTGEDSNKVEMEMNFSDLKRCYLKCVLQANSIGAIWELVRHAKISGTIQAYRIRHTFKQESLVIYTHVKVWETPV